MDMPRQHVTRHVCMASCRPKLSVTQKLSASVNTLASQPYMLVHAGCHHVQMQAATSLVCVRAWHNNSSRSTLMHRTCTGASQIKCDA